ncbi:S-4TM family putative pore-forming effector [Streptomyces tendae]|uniref:S-4TM family putative pore-forming effector n=1 Tax=Streptomyces tendae TaxID=1932 RepID=UPI001172EDD6
MASTHPIADRQESAAAMRVLKAIAVAHLRNQRAQSLSLGVSVALAVAGLLIGSGSRYGTAITLSGTLWAALYMGVMAPWAERYLRIAATLQEMFDADVLGLPWNSVAAGHRISDDEVSRLSRRFRGADDRLRGYYLSVDAAAPYDVLFCLEQNLAWGSRVRLRFAQLMLGVLVLWSVAGVLLTLATDGTLSRLVTGWFVPSLALLLLCLEMHRTQMTSIQERQRVLFRRGDWAARGPATLACHQEIGYLGRHHRFAVEGCGHRPLQRRHRRLARHHRPGTGPHRPHGQGCVVGRRQRDHKRAGP